MKIMDDELFFPNINRREDYLVKTTGEYYSDYSRYRTQISEDCGERCVYCDVLLEEIGYEGMVLDHFRPQKLFPDLKSNPENLVLSCPKCNSLKSDHWPEDCGVDDTFVGNVGFVDPFIDSKNDFFIVDENGVFIPKQPPSPYMEKLLSVNRVSRKLVRKKRILSEVIRRHYDDIIEDNDLSQQKLDAGIMAVGDFIEKAKRNQEKLKLIRTLME